MGKRNGNHSDMEKQERPQASKENENCSSSFQRMLPRIRPRLPKERQIGHQPICNPNDKHTQPKKRDPHIQNFKKSKTFKGTTNKACSKERKRNGDFKKSQQLKRTRARKPGSIEPYYMSNK